MGTKTLPVLRITIHGAKGLKSHGEVSEPRDGVSELRQFSGHVHLPCLLGSMNMSGHYCMCEVFNNSESRFKTHVEDGSNPEWEHEDELVDFVMGDTLLFKLLAKDTVLGTATLHSTMFFASPFDGKLDVVNADKCVQGVLRVTVTAENLVDMMEWGCSSKQVPSIAYSKHLMRNLALGTPCYVSGSPWKDYFFHVANAHPLLGIGLSHPAHPYSKVERACVLLVTLALTIVPSAVLEFYLPFDLNFFAILCCVTIPVMIVQTFLEKITTYDVWVKGEKTTCFVKVLAAYFVASSVAFSACACVIPIMMTLVMGVSFAKVIEHLAVSQLQHWVTWFLYDLLLPCCGFVWTWRAEAARARLGTDAYVMDPAKDGPADTSANP
mmetsp:Transcript_20640/g.27850  ORF Transcript_20640/g.27850 Transcript_20640/m.27850 type:complete len:381 (-) Transcript_20640:363-1505(-)